MSPSAPAPSEPLSEAQTAEPSPSPALSAYSYTSSTSSSSDYDLNSLSLDDWGFPTQGGESVPPRALGMRAGVGSARAAQGYHLSGASTPIAKRDSPGSAMFTRASKAEKREAGNILEEEEEEEDDEEDGEPSGFDAEDEDEDDMHAHGVPAARGWRLKAR